MPCFSRFPRRLDAGLGLALLVSASCSSSRSGNDPVSGRTSDTPVLRQASLVDLDQNGVDAGDVVILVFSRRVVVHGSSLDGFELTTPGDDFGVGAELLQSQPGGDRVEIILGDAPQLEPDVSGLNLAAFGAGLVQVTTADDEAIRAARAERDVTIEDLTQSAPVLLEARLVDVDADGEIRGGDRVVATFNKPVAIPGGATVDDNFFLVHPGDSLGTFPALETTSNGLVQRAVSIVLGENPLLNSTGLVTRGAQIAEVAAEIGVAAAPTITDGLPATPNALSPGVSVGVAVFAATFPGDGRSADAALGSSDAEAPALSASGLRDPAGVDSFVGTLEIGEESIAASLLFVADRGNHRVLIFDSVPVASFPAATWVLGAPDLTTLADVDPTDLDARSTTASNLLVPADVAFDATTNRLFVADTGQHRILVWDDLFAVDGETGELTVENHRAASFAWGQSVLVVGEANRGLSGPTAVTLSAPMGIEVRAGRLLVADSGNHRVLLFDSLPDSSTTLPAAVLGQTDFIAGEANRGGAVAADTLSSPVDVLSSGVGVLVVDAGNHRVLLYSTDPPATGAAADAAIGQVDLVTGDPALAATRLRSPTGVTADDSTSLLYVADAGNHRLMAYSTASGLASGVAGAPLGQTTVTAGSANQGGAVGASTLSSPGALAIVSSALMVADSGNHRLLVYGGGALPTADRPATLVVGQSSFTAGTAAGRRFQQPFDVAVVRGQLLVADTANHRVLIYNSLPRSGDPDPDLVLGQADLHSTRPNRGGSPSAASLNLPTAVASDGIRLVVSDTGNHRVLIWSAFPTVPGAPADVVLGQPGAADNLVNAGSAPSSSTLHSPAGLAIIDDVLVVADRDNHRVLVFAGLASLSSGAPASHVLGQRRFDEVEPNRGLAASASTLRGPRDVLFGAGKLHVADTGNHRLLVWDGVPRRSNQPATAFYGQGGFSSVVMSPPSPVSLLSPSGLAMDPRQRILAVSDTANHRVVFIEVGEGIDARRRAGGGVLGRPSLFDGGIGAPGLGTLELPQGLFWNGFELHVADAGSNRIVAFR